MFVYMWRSFCGKTLVTLSSLTGIVYQQLIVLFVTLYILFIYISVVAVESAYTYTVYSVWDELKT